MQHFQQQIKIRISLRCAGLAIQQTLKSMKFEVIATITIDIGVVSDVTQCSLIYR
jgi:hypothetical protein